MKKRILLISIAVIVAVTFVSCEGDIFQSISDFMGQTGSNVYLDGGVVTVPTENIDALEETLGGTTTDPVTPEQIEDVKDSVEAILESEGETDAAKELLEEPVTPSEIPSDVKGVMEDLEDELGLEEGTLDIEDKGDLAAAILLKNLKDKKAALPADPTDEEKAAFVEEAQLVIEFMKKVSPVGDIDVTTAITDLLAGMFEERSATRGVSDPLFDMEEVLGYAVPVFNMYFNVIDEDDNGTVTSAELKDIVGDYAVLRSTYEDTLGSLSVGDMKLSDLITYASSVIISSNDALIPETVKDGIAPTYPPTDFVTILNLVYQYFIVGGNTEMPSDTDTNWWFIDETMYDQWGSTFDSFMNDSANEDILPTLLAISGAIEDNEFITGLLEEFVEDFTGGDE
ncbi:MAG: hypothetical protein PQJ35_00865 [Sphaerochaetaceae bacterium]|nr:hypothetical protein [Sphaerochaetaceae bacterium]